MMPMYAFFLLPPLVSLALVLVAVVLVTMVLVMMVLVAVRLFLSIFIISATGAQWVSGGSALTMEIRERLWGLSH
eukprot:m.246142 g.246142  ORF g.246142 m.246142 type:complete len:75 (-) comp41336_c0_seq1:287-511(-)